MAAQRHADRVQAVVEDRSSAARSAVAASWIRSVSRYGLDPEQSRPPTSVEARELARARERLGALVHAAQPSLDRLFQAVGDSGCCVLLTDAQGIPLERRGVTADDDTFRRWGLWTGMVWDEATEGTNGVGTCLAEGRTLTIHRDQHFFTRNIGLSCTTAPIHDQHGRLVAALDVSSCRADLDRGMVNLIATTVGDAARRIEAAHFRLAFPDARIVIGPDTEREAGALIAVDRHDMVVGATRAARMLYGISDERLAGQLPADVILRARGTTRSMTWFRPNATWSSGRWPGRAAMYRARPGRWG